MKGNIIVKIPDSILDSALALRGKERSILRGKMSTSNVSDLVKTYPKHVNSKIKCLSQEIKNAAKYLQYLLAFSYVFFSEFLAKQLADSLSSEVKFKLLAKNNNKN